ncbi:MAG: hypothetical protein GEV13_14745 [Rhodospirillales bacterium]|nr:hypothetical protein [Rhodospirillales bacterium]
MSASQKPTSTLEEFTTEAIDAHYVERRWNDWSNRVKALYQQVRQWLNPDLACKEGSAIFFQEELMKSTGVPAKQLVSLDIFDGSRRIGGLRPVALWVIGANGRIDIDSPSGSYTIVDIAKNFDPPKWEIVPIAGPRKPEGLSRKTFRHLFVS